jgi:hypothetical protein
MLAYSAHSHKSFIKINLISSVCTAKQLQSAILLIKQKIKFGMKHYLAAISRSNYVMIKLHLVWSQQPNSCDSHLHPWQSFVPVTVMCTCDSHLYLWLSHLYLWVICTCDSQVHMTVTGTNDCHSYKCLSHRYKWLSQVQMTVTGTNDFLYECLNN